MPSLYRSKAIVYVANVAALPPVGSDGYVYVVNDDGTGKPAIFIWDNSSSSWVPSSGAGAGSRPWQNTVITITISDPTPLTPAVGDRYIVWPVGAGAWTGHDNEIAEWDGTQWDFTAPSEGYAVYVKDENHVYFYDAIVAGAWATLLVKGPASVADNTIAIYDSLTGRLLKVVNQATLQYDLFGGALPGIFLQLDGDVTYPNSIIILDAHANTNFARFLMTVNGVPIAGCGYRSASGFVIDVVGSIPIVEELGTNDGTSEWEVQDSDQAVVAAIDSDGTLKNVGGRSIGRTAVADSNHSVLKGQYLIAYTSITATRTVTLPDPTTIPVNTVFKINDESGAVTALIKITIDTAAGNIDGVASLDITNAYGTAKVYSNGTNYFTL